MVVEVAPYDRSPFDTKQKWLGGYTDPCRDISYDYAGRAIRTRDYTNNGYSLEVPSLYVPDYKENGMVLEIDLSHGKKAKP